MNSDIKIAGRFWVEFEGAPSVGRGRIDLLERIRDSGSINEAAKAMKMSYKSAWDAIQSINQAALPVVTKSKGGRAGGGSQLTAYGMALINTFRTMEREHRIFLEELRSRHVSLLQDSMDCHQKTNSEEQTTPLPKMRKPKKQ